MLPTESHATSRKQKHFRVGLASAAADIRAAQSLRCQVFAEEMGARLDAPEPGLDIDLYDGWCHHLLVREVDTGDAVGTPLEWQVYPRCPLPLTPISHAAAPIVPSLTKGYLRLGAWVCGAPASDPDFNLADRVRLSLQPEPRLCKALHARQGTETAP